MLQLKGVGETVVTRLEEVGFSTLRQLSQEDAVWITKQIAAQLGSTCWQNSPQARKAIQAIIDLANSATYSVS